MAVDISNISAELERRKRETEHLAFIAEMEKKRDTLPEYQRDTLDDLEKLYGLTPADAEYPFDSQEQRDTILETLYTNLKLAYEASETGIGKKTAEIRSNIVNGMSRDFCDYFEELKRDMDAQENRLTIADRVRNAGEMVKDKLGNAWDRAKEEIRSAPSLWKNLKQAAAEAIGKIGELARSVGNTAKDKYIQIALAYRNKCERNFTETIAIGFGTERLIKNYENSAQSLNAQHKSAALKAMLLNIPRRAANIGIAIGNAVKFTAQGELKNALTGMKVNFTPMEYKDLIDPDSLEVNRPKDVKNSIKNVEDTIARAAIRKGLNRAKMLNLALMGTKPEDRQALADTFVGEMLKDFSAVTKEWTEPGLIVKDGEIHTVKYGAEGIEYDGKLMEEGKDYEHISEFFTPSAITRMFVEAEKDGMVQHYMKTALEQTGLTRDRDLSDGLDWMTKAKSSIENNLKHGIAIATILNHRYEKEAEHIAERMEKLLGKEQPDFEGPLFDPVDPRTPEERSDMPNIQGEDIAPAEKENSEAERDDGDER